MATTRDRPSVRRRGDLAVVDLPRLIDLDAEQALNEAYGETAADAKTVLLNFAGVDYINSSGIAVLVGLLARARKERRGIAACGLSEHYREIFQITRLAEFIPIYTDEESAEHPGEGRR